MATLSLQTSYDELCDHARQTAILASIESILAWDERTQMPAAAGAYRSEQMAFIAGEIHRRKTDPRVRDWLAELKESPLADERHSDTGATIRWIARDFEKSQKLPQSLVEELARTASQGEQVWAAARKENDFTTFLPILEKTIDLKRQQAAAYGYDDSPYDPLLDDYEPGATTREVGAILGQLAEELVPLVQAITRSARQPDTSLCKRPCSVAEQDAFGRRAAEAIGYEFNAGRLDTTTHPFCATLGPRDVRITTRYGGHLVDSALYSTLHEAGHAIYEQGLTAEQFGLPLGESASLGIHESQSRMWENMVGRSYAFWEHFFPAARQSFPTAFGDATLDDFYLVVNAVRPSLIRVDADEATYNLHIVIRFELEKALITGDLPPADLPAAWKAKYQQYLGIEPPSDADGCLQDVHWSAGLIGYFPTYALGNLYAAQFFEKARSVLGDLDAMFRVGDFATLREWLGANIHQQGRRYSAGELVEHVTGRPLAHDALLAYLRSKLGPLYGQDRDLRDDVPLEIAPTDDAPAETPSFDFGDTADIPQRVDLGPYEAARQVLAAPLPRRKPKSFLRQILGVFGGGMIGLLLGYYILLWIGGPDMDFLEIGDHLPRWAVPTSFHSDSLVGSLDASSSSLQLPVAVASSRRGSSWRQDATTTCRRRDSHGGKMPPPRQGPSAEEQRPGRRRPGR